MKMMHQVVRRWLDRSENLFSTKTSKNGFGKIIVITWKIEISLNTHISSKNRNLQASSDLSNVTFLFFSFMWQICGHVPQSLLVLNDITFRAAQLSVSFFMETFIHAKEKVNYSIIIIIIFNDF